MKIFSKLSKNFFQNLLKAKKITSNFRRVNTTQQKE